MGRLSRILAVLILLPVAAVWAKKTAAPVEFKAGTPEAAKAQQDLVLSTLVKGNSEFRKAQAAGPKSHATKAPQAKAASKLPLRAMVLTCADSPMDAERIFHAHPGEIFSVRVAGNVASPDVVASLEYGAHELNLPVLVVLGHQSCRAVETCLANLAGENSDRVTVNGQALLDRLEPACTDAKKDGFKGDALLQAAVTDNVKNTIRSILEESPELWQLQHQGKLRVVGAVYTKSGEVKWLE